MGWLSLKRITGSEGLNLGGAAKELEKAIIRPIGGAVENALENPVQLVGLALAVAAPGVGSAIGASLGLTGTAATVVGNAVLQGTLAEAQGGDFLDGAIKGAVTAGVAPPVANAVGQSVSNIMADTAVKSVVSNAISSSAASAVTAALTGGDVANAALTGALAGAGGSVGRELGTAAEYSTDPFSQQTQMLAGQEQGLGTSGAVGANLGVAAGVTAAGGDSTSALINALTKTAAEISRAEGTPVEEKVGQGGVLAPSEGQIPPVSDVTGVVTPPGAETEIPPPSTQEIPIPDQISQELPVPDYGVQDLGIPQENLDSFNQNLLQMQEEGRLPSQWSPNGDGTFTYVGDEGSTVTITPDADITDVTEAPLGNLLGEEMEAGALTKDTADKPISPEGMASQTPYIKDFYISSGRRRDFGPTVSTLGQALQAPFFPSSPVSGLTSYRGAGEIEGQRTGKPRRDVWNESSLRLTDALGL